MNTLLKEKRYKKFRTELKICKIGGLFLALYRNKEVPEAIIKLLENDDYLAGIFQFPLYMNKDKVRFPILFEQTFEQMGSQSNIYHVLGTENNLSSAKAKEFLGYLQYARERFKAKPYSLVFWITPEFEKELFFQAPDFHHWVFGTYDFTDINDNELKITSSSGNEESFDTQKIDQYLQKVIWQYQNWEVVKKNNESFLLEPMERTDLYNYYIQSYCVDKNRKEHLLDDFLEEFIKDSKQSSLIGLGDFGTGKSSFSIHYFIELAKKYLDDKTKRIPIFISLKDYKGRLNIEKFIIREFYNKFDLKINFSIFQRLALEGKFIFFIDGFDEMASLADKQVTIQNLKELTKLSFENVLFMTKSQNKNYKANKIFLTSRTHYFLTESQEKEILKADYTILYRNYATKSNYEITRIKLKEFNKNQIKEYIQKHTNNKELTNQYLKIIENTYNLKELSTRPLLLEMIIKTIDEFKEQQNINTSDLYRAYTNIWIERDDWRSQMKPQGKRSFMREMAVKMFDLGGDFSLHYSKLDKPKHEYLKDSYKEEEDYYKYEVTTCTFLNRDNDGNYKFIHKSFMEYFVAESFYWHLRNYDTLISDYFSLNTEIKFFLNNIIALHKDRLDGLDFRNFDLSRINLRSGSLNNANLSDANLSDADFRNAKLNGAKLNGADLSTVNLRGADLRNANLSGANLSDANLSGVDLSTVNLSGVYLRGANLSEANLSDANLNGVNFTYANLSHANLSHANLTHANLTHVKLIGANLVGTNLSHAELVDTNLRNANLREANFGGADLSCAILDGAVLINNQYLTYYQIKSACFWEQAIYKGKWDDKQEKWIIDEQANQEYIEQLQQSI